MEWQNIQVQHRAFGSGVVMKNEAGYITVRFGENEKTFSYPSVFRDFMAVENEEAKCAVGLALQEMDAAQDQEKLMRLARLTELRKEAATERTAARSAARKTAPKKEKKTEE